MENIIDKLNQIKDEDTKNIWNNWTLEEIKNLLNIYFIISKKEAHIFELIYSYHGCDSWEDIFRDYSTSYLEDKATGVEIAINEIIEQIKKDKRHKK
jgi:hypothetical protein